MIGSAAFFRAWNVMTALSVTPGTPAAAQAPPAPPAPVLLVLANRDFYAPDYGPLRASLEAEGLTVRVAAGTLDDAAWAIPTSHIWAERGNGAMPPADDALVIEGPPADRQALWDRFARLYPASA